MRKFKVQLIPSRKCEVQLESDFPISIDQARKVLSLSEIKYNEKDLIELGKKFYAIKLVEREVLADSGLYTLGLQHVQGKYFFKVFIKSLKKEIIEVD